MTDKAEIAVSNYVTKGLIAAQVGYTWSQAMREAGYPDKYIRSNGTWLRRKPEVQKVIQQTKDKLLRKNELKADDVIKELKKIAFRSADEFAEQDDETKVLKFKEFKEISERAKASIESIKIGQKGDVELKIASKLNALEQLGRHFGIYDKDNAQRAKPFVLVFNHKDRVKPVESKTRA